MNGYDPWEASNRAYANFGATLSDLANMDRQRKMDAMQQQQFDQGMSLANLQLQRERDTAMKERAGNRALIDLYGTGDRATEEDQLASALTFQAQKSQEMDAQKRKREGMNQFFTSIDNFKKAGASPQFLTEFTKLEMGKDPDLAKIAPFVSYMDGETMEITRDFAAGELKDPTNGQPMPAGKYAIKGRATGDPNNPFKPMSITPAKADDINEFELFVQSGRKGGKSDADLLNEWNEREMGRKKAGATNVSTKVSMKGDSKGLEAIAGKMPEYKDQAETAYTAKEKITRMKGLIDIGAAGSRGYAKAKIAPLLEMVGVTTKGLNDAQLYQKLASTLKGSMRLQIVGPGPVSNYEQGLLDQVSGGGFTGAEAARELLTFYESEADRKIRTYNSTVDAISKNMPETAGVYEKINVSGAPQNPPTPHNPKPAPGKGGGNAPPKTAAEFLARKRGQK